MELFINFSKEELLKFKKGQKIMTNMLKEFDSICRNNGLKYWCVGGTLIGAVRNNGWIPHDGDIDVAMLEYDYDKLQKIIQSHLSKDYWFQNKFRDKYYKSNLGKIRYLYGYYGDYKYKRWYNGLQLDIFVFTEVIKGNLLTTKKNNGFYFGENIIKEMIFPLKEMFFEDIKVYVPNNYKQYCIDAWGGCPPPELPIDKQYPAEGRISFAIPTWIKIMYPHLYLN